MGRRRPPVDTLPPNIGISAGMVMPPGAYLAPGGAAIGCSAKINGVIDLVGRSLGRHSDADHGSIQYCVWLAKRV